MNKSSGIIRRLDELGRIVLPIELRKKLKIKEKDEMEFFIQNEDIILRKCLNSCCFCNSQKNLIEFKEKLICDKCIKEISDDINKENNEDEKVTESSNGQTESID